MKTAADLVTEARARVEELDPDQVEKEMTYGNVVLVDLREPDELAQEGRIAGSIAVPRGMLEFRADPASPYHDARFSPDRRIILQCASGGRSALAADVLQSMGYTDVAHLGGGLKAWKAAQKPVQ